MTTTWNYFWPIFAAGLVCGAFAMWWSYRHVRARRPRHHRRVSLMAGFGAAFACTLLWHWPLGGAGRLTGEIEHTARATLDYYELPQVRALVQPSPLTRRIVLSGPADRFQQRELVRIMNDVPGVGSVAWRSAAGQSRSRLMLPLLAEAIFTALAGAVAGMLMAHLLELRRRANAEWSW